MSDSSQPPLAESPEIVMPGSGPGQDQPSEEAGESTEAVNEPAKVMRIGAMIRTLLAEVKETELDEASRERLADMYDTSIIELSSALSPDLQEELQRLALPFDDDSTPSEAELRVAQAQIVGWLEGLFHGIQATLFAQQMEARAQLEQMQQQALGQGGPPVAPQPPGGENRPGVYL
ncbi:MAG: bacterial proteasome activator family protein [Actinomycetia bacterium]|nr:bacterial proteasome activator family protein [Actinomycetes bacterium]MCP3909512.1 bacterial proteasome activator family protein [Actinomycetes bacterium]MCP4084269.1 bacterial proteasome activator family protein [Actinomycetes bacterium]